MGILEKIKEIELEMARTQKNKATEYHLGQLKARLAKLRTELQAPSSKGGGGESGFEVQKYGDGRVALIGFPSVGKSSLLTLLTGTESEAAAYEFTTLTCIPGVIHYNDSKIQLLDLPGIIEGAAEGKGRGRQVIAVCKSADLLLMVLDATKPLYHKQILTRELEAVGIRLNRQPPNIYFKKRKTGGISINSTIPLTHLDDKLIQRVLQEYKLHNCELLFKEDCTVDDLIDVIEGNRRYIKCLYVYNKVDMCSLEEVAEIAGWSNSIPISCSLKLNMDGLLERIWDMMALVRVYTKKVGAKPDFADPVVLTSDRGGTTLEALCRQIHNSMVQQFKYALVWGTSSKHYPQRCGLSHQLEDEDVVQIVKKKVNTGEDGRGRFKTTSDKPLRIADREKKPALKT
ncbi:Developmentally-regulated GTP-binding protein 2 [Pleodorina starrii]|uniref:Developmentally-regulated GTP-binding protein 2 n=1 Tax=Pleodorina starrii TaxID=330485 RepID=A0A9W6F319_9CHLO|nr:Developmentally-regulated GTP-binding protein 2 [Pleodorina starrii]GLC53970.1 Developmentally-regulated GTP-binding protein 2 [Pleodorina starrii]GLC70253.1 Developmentally-regulated GTP-binding protein 2 [Pleodorina starrii]